MKPQNGLIKYQNKMLKKLPVMTLKTAQEVLKDSNSIVPVDSGTLRDSGRIYQDPKTGECQVFYTEDYAVFVHEDLSKYHPNGQAKFLEKALIDNADEFLKNIKMAVETK